jgi:hypothetical protein
MPRIRDRQISLVILLLFTLLGIVRHLDGGDDLAASYFGCQLLASGQASHLYSHSAVDFATVDDPVWHTLAANANFLPPVGYVHPYVQTPLWAFALQPACTRISFQAFNRIFIVLVMLATTGMLLLVLHFWTPILFRPIPVALICALFYRAEPLRYALALTQAHVIFLLFTLLAILLAQRNRPIAAGTLLAIAASIKMTPAFLILYWLARRQFKPALSFVISFAAICIFTILATGPSVTLAYLHELSEISNVLLVSYNNQSLAATWMTHTVPTNELLAFRIYPLPAVIKITSLLAIVTASLAGGWLDRKNALRYLPPYGAIFAMVAATVLTPIAWTHYFILLVIPCMFLAAAARRDRDIPVRRNLWIFLALPLIAFNIYPLGTEVFHWTQATAIVIRPQFYTAILSLAALWLMARQQFVTEAIPISPANALHSQSPSARPADTTTCSDTSASPAPR